MVRDFETELRVARRAFERLNKATPDEARDEQGWTPELLAAAQRWNDALGVRLEQDMLEAESLQRFWSRYKDTQPG